MSIQFENIRFTYYEGRKDILNGLSAEFDASEITILTGASGCGKSTLLYLTAGIYPHSAGILREGSVSVDGVQPDSLPPSKRCRLVGMMFQNPELQFCMDTVEHELIFCLENIRTEPEKMDGIVTEALEFCGIAHLKKRTLLSLSGGEKQKLMLACMTALSPKWLLLDEPFANIDDDSAREIAAKLKCLNRTRGMGILAVDHRLDNWLEAADTVRVMENGVLGEEKMDARHLDEKRLLELGIIVPGSSYENHPAPPSQNSEPVLVLDHLTLSHGKKEILKGINVSFCAGHIYAIVGKSGCGKSSLFGALSGLYAYGGHALLGGRELKRLRTKEMGQIGFVTQDPGDQFVSDTVRQEILVGLGKNKDAEAQAEKILRSIRLWRYRDISPWLLSQGQQRRLGVAALMAYPCRVLVCDEPTYAQDRNNTIAIMESLCERAREDGVALIFSTHDGQLARDYADEIYELKEGKLYAHAESGS